MVEICYDEKPHVFVFSYSKKEYIPAKYFESNRDIKSVELHYFKDLLKDNKMLSKDDVGTTLIWSVHYDCFYCQIPFTMVYDEDYGFVSFAVNDPKDRVTVAEAIQTLMEKKKHFNSPSTPKIKKPEKSP
jgi:hypothetical protein